MRGKIILIVLILIPFFLIWFYLNEVKIKDMTHTSRDWLKFLKPNMIPSEINLTVKNGDFFTAWDINLTKFNSLIKFDENGTKYTLGISIPSYSFLNQERAREILDAFSTLRPNDFKCNASQSNLEKEVIICNSYADNKDITIFSYRGAKGEETYISISEVSIKR